MSALTVLAWLTPRENVRTQQAHNIDARGSHWALFPRITKSSFFCDKTSRHQLVRCRLAAKWGVRNRGDASSVSRTGAPHQIQRAKRTLTVAESGARRNRTRNNIKHNVGRIHTYLEVLVLIDLVPLIVAKVPVSLEKFMMSNVVPSVGVKLLINSRFKVPPSFAAPLMLSWSYSVFAVVPPISIGRMPVEDCW